MKRKTLIVIIVVLVVIFIALYLYKRRKTNSQQTITANPPASTTTTTVSAANDDFPLVKGSEGENVRYLQWAINRIAPGTNLTEDGKFGTKTYSALLVNIGASYYPVTQAKWTTILNRANDN